MTPDMQWLIAQLQERMERGFYGTIQISFKGGRLIVMRVDETLQPPRDANGSEADTPA